MASPGEPAIPREIADAVQALARAMERLPEVEQLKRAREEIGRHEAARIMLRDLRRRERQLAEKSRRGEKPSEQEVEELQKVAEVVGFNPYIRALWEAEVAFAGLMAAVVQAIEQALAIPPALEEDQQETAAPEGAAASGAAAAGAGPGQAPASGRVTPARTRLWVPGQP